MKKKTNHVMTSGEILSKKKNKSIVVLSIVLLLSMLFNVYLFTDLSIPGIDELIPLKSRSISNKEDEITIGEKQGELIEIIEKPKTDSVESEKEEHGSTDISGSTGVVKDVEDENSNESQDGVTTKLTEPDIKKLDTSTVESFEKESGLQLKYDKKILNQKAIIEPDNSRGELWFDDDDNLCSSFIFFDGGCQVFFVDGENCTFNVEKANEFKEIFKKSQLIYYSQPYYETEGGKIVHVNIERFSLYLSSVNGSVNGEFFIPDNYGEMKEYFEKLYQICISE